MNGVRHLGSARTFYEECLDAGEALNAKGYGLDSGKLLAVYPTVYGNPYLHMLYASALEHGYAPIALESLSQLDEVPTGLRVVVHHHWLHRIFDRLENVADAKRAALEFLARVQKQKDTGHDLVWTVHNVLSHQTDFPEEEARLRADFAQLADHIHIMNPDTANLCAPHYLLDENKVFQVPHPAYTGVYADFVRCEQARLTLGLQPNDHVFLLFGALGANKGTRQFLAQLDALQARMDGKAVVIIAGREGSGVFMEDIYSLTSGRADVRLYIGHIEDRHIQNFFRAADVAVCAHTAGLNSGVTATGLTFGCATVAASRMAGCVEGAEEFVATFDVAKPETLVEACVAAFEMSKLPEIGQKLAAWGQEMAPVRISSRFFEALERRL